MPTRPVRGTSGDASDSNTPAAPEPREPATAPRGNVARGAAYGLGAGAIWGGMYVVSDAVLPVIPPFTLLALRLLLGALVLGALVAWRRPPPVAARDLPALLAVGLLGFGVSLGAQFVGTDQSTAINGALVTSASPAFIVLFAALLLGEPLTRRQLTAVALATLGVVVIVDPTRADFGSDTFRGDLALALAALTWGLYSVLVRKISERTDTLLVTLWGFLGGLLLVLPAALLEQQARSIGQVDAAIVAGVLYLGAVSTAGAMWLWNRAFALVAAALASLFFFAQPLTGAVLAAILLGQGLTIGLAVGGALIAFGVLLPLTPRGPRRSAPRRGASLLAAAQPPACSACEGATRPFSRAREWRADRAP